MHTHRRNFIKNSLQHRILQFRALQSHKRHQNHSNKRIQRWLEPELFQPFLFGLLLALMFSEFVRGALTLSLLPTYGKTVLGFAVEWTALALSLHYLVDTLFRAPVGWVIDRVGQRGVLLAGLAISFTAIYWMSHLHTITSLLLCASLYGLGVTPMWPAAMSGISLSTPTFKRASFVGYLYIFWLVGTGLGPVLINLVIGPTYHFAFALLLIVNGLAFLTTFFLVHAPVQKVRAQSHFKSTDWVGLWKNIREVAYLFPGMFAQTFAVSSLIPILALYAKLILKVSGLTYSSILVAGGVFTIVMLIPAGRLVDKFGARIFLVGAFFLAGTTLSIYPLHHTLVTTYIVVAVLGIAYGFILPAWNFVLDRNIDADKKATLWGVFMTVEGLGSSLGPYLGGKVWDSLSPEAPFWMSAIVIFLMGALYIVLPIHKRQSNAHSAAPHLLHNLEHSVNRPRDPKAKI